MLRWYRAAGWRYRSTSDHPATAIARQFGLGSSPGSGDELVWSMLREELARMVLAYLGFDG